MTEQEVQHAEVSIKVALPVGKGTSEEARLDAIMRKIRLEMGNGIEIRPPLLAEHGELTHTETMDEAAERNMAEAEARAEREMERRIAEHIDRHGYF